MSVLVTSWIWKHSQEKWGYRLVLLALADHAHDDGSSAYPSIETIGDKTLLARRSVQIILRGLEKRGAVRGTKGAGPRGTTSWQIVMDGGAIVAPLASSRRGGKRTPRTGAKNGPGQGATAAQGPSVFAPKPSVTRAVNHQRTSVDVLSSLRRIEADPGISEASRSRARRKRQRLEGSEA